MSEVIRVPADIYSRLKERASGFDTPADVIERLLNHNDGGVVPLIERLVPENNGHDLTRYSFKDTTGHTDGQIYCKNRLVLAIIKDYVSKNSGITFNGLEIMFPRNLQGSLGVFNKFSDVQTRYEGQPNKRHFMNEAEQIQLKDCTIVVCTEWGLFNIDDFIDYANNRGYEISRHPE